jgi:hypothetical protein
MYRQWEIIIGALIITLKRMIYKVLAVISNDTAIGHKPHKACVILLDISDAIGW